MIDNLIPYKQDETNIVQKLFIDYTYCDQKKYANNVIANQANYIDMVLHTYLVIKNDNACS